jgi:hypothetical protein
MKMIYMKLAIISVILLALIGVFLIVQNSLQYSPSGPAISGTQELVLNEQDLQQLGMTSEADCRTEEQTSYSSNLVQYTICAYLIPSLNDTEVIIEMKKFTNLEDLNDSYQYDSSHLYSVEGLISENDYGDQSRFRVNNENDYMGHLNEPGVYYYHLWICKDEYLIHITSSGRSEEAGEYITETGQLILSKFG